MNSDEVAYHFDKLSIKERNAFLKIKGIEACDDILKITREIPTFGSLLLAMAVITNSNIGEQYAIKAWNQFWEEHNESLVGEDMYILYNIAIQREHTIEAQVAQFKQEIEDGLS